MARGNGELLPPAGFAVNGRLTIKVLRRGWVKIGCWAAPTRVLRKHAKDLARFASKPEGPIETTAVGRRWRLLEKPADDERILVQVWPSATNAEDTTCWTFVSAQDAAAVAAVLLVCCQMADRL